MYRIASWSLVCLVALLSVFHPASAQSFSADELDASYQEATASGDYTRHLDLINRTAPGQGGNYEFLWRAARGSWACGDYLYWQYMVENVKAARPECVEDVLDAEKDLTEAQGAKLIELGRTAWAFAEKAAALHPERIEAHYYYSLSISIYALGKSIIAALREGLRGKFDDEVDAAIAIEPGYAEGGPLRVKARSYFKLPWPLRDYDKSVEILGRAAELGPRAPLTTLFLGDSYWKLGRQDEARQAWQRTVGLAEERKHEAVAHYLAENARLKLASSLR